MIVRVMSCVVVVSSSCVVSMRVAVSVCRCCVVRCCGVSCAYRCRVVCGVVVCGVSRRRASRRTTLCACVATRRVVCVVSRYVVRYDGRTVMSRRLSVSRVDGVAWPAANLPVTQINLSGGNPGLAGVLAEAGGNAGGGRRRIYSGRRAAAHRTYLIGLF